MTQPTQRPCERPGCSNPKVPGQGGKLCQEHRSEYDVWRRRDRYYIPICQMDGCTEPKLRGRGQRYCAAHSAESGQREIAQIIRRKREREYGLSHDAFLALLNEQGGVCAICGKPEDSRLRRTLSVDHDHATGTVRGLLCNRCNPLLGYARDDVEVLRAAIAYLQRVQVFKPPQGVYL